MARAPRLTEPMQEHGVEVMEKAEYLKQQKMRGAKSQPERDSDVCESVESELRRLSEYLDELHGAIESHSQALRPILNNGDEATSGMQQFMLSESNSEIRNRLMQSTNVVIAAIERIRNLTHAVDL